MKRYWVAHARGSDFALLEQRGFLTYYPAMDDYVFLEATEEHNGAWNSQEEMGVSFLKLKGKPVILGEEEVERMAPKGVIAVKVGDRVKVLEGPAEGMVGIVTGNRGVKVEVMVKGWHRLYAVEVKKQALARVEDKG